MADKAHQRPIKDWPEMRKVDVSGLAAYTEAMIQRENRENKKLLIRRSRVLQVLVAFQFYTIGVVLWELLRTVLRHGQYDVIAMAPSDFNAICQLASCGYFLVGKRPAFGAQIVGVIFILNIIELSLSLPVFYAGGLLLTLANIALLGLAYRQLKYLSSHWF